MIENNVKLNELIAIFPALEELNNAIQHFEQHHPVWKICDVIVQLVDTVFNPKDVVAEAALEQQAEKS